ncbi:hypothetical protein GCM10009753_22600 [Streptantibioticus ferralitis]
MHDGGSGGGHHGGGFGGHHHGGGLGGHHHHTGDDSQLFPVTGSRRPSGLRTVDGRILIVALLLAIGLIGLTVAGH